MHSDRSEYGQRRQYGDRGSRQWDDYGDRREERGEPHRGARQNSYYKYCSNGHSSERTSRGRDFSDSPPRIYAKDASSRDRGRQSPLRRRKCSPDWSVSDRKKPRFTDDGKDEYRYRGGSDDRMDRQSPDFSHGPKDFKQKLPHQDGFKYGKGPPDSRSRHVQEDFSYRHSHDNSSYRRPSGYHTDRDSEGSRRRRSHERVQPREGSHSAPQSYARSSERHLSPMEHKEHHISGQPFEHQSTSKPLANEEKKSSNGFQRFLDVLNKGVNVETLTKIVTQTAATSGSDQLHSPDSFQSVTDPPPAVAASQQEGHQYSHDWREWHRRSPSPKESSFSEENSGRPRSASPPAVEKTPEDEHKRRQMQDVLQAIGLDLGFEELGQMSHRIQERLYGRRDSERGGPGRGGAERPARPPFSPRRQSRSSSSSRSSCNPSLSRDFPSRPSDEAEERLGAGEGEYAAGSRDSACAAAFPPDGAYAAPETPHASAVPTYSPVNYPPLLYPPLPPALPHLHPRLLPPHRPPVLPFPCVPPLNLLPAVLAQTRHILPPQLHQAPYFNLPAAQPLSNTPKAKTLSRPRCLQVIETKQPG